MNEASGATKKILIVEDDLNSRVGLRNSLAQQGYEVATAANSFEAVMKMKADVSIGIFDLDLPASSVLRSAAGILSGSSGPGNPMARSLVVSARDGYDAAQAKRWRIADCLVKPITPSASRPSSRRSSLTKLNAVSGYCSGPLSGGSAGRYGPVHRTPFYGDAL